MRNLSSCSFLLLLAFQSACSGGVDVSATEQRADSAVQGPPGPQGPIGPQGPAGPAGSFRTIEAPRRLTTAERNSLLTVNGLLNNTGANIWLNGRIQMFRVLHNCRAVDVDVLWPGSTQWIRLQSFFVEGVRTNIDPETQINMGNGMSFSTQVILPPEARVRLKQDRNPNCASGQTFLGGVAEGGLTEDQVYDWAIFPLR